MMMKRFFNQLTRVSMLLTIMVLPIEYHRGDSDSSNVAVGVHGGAGQVVTVIRDCEGNPLASEASSFADVSAFAKLRLPSSFYLPATCGVRAGYWQSDMKHPQVLGSSLWKFTYLNPHLDVEYKYIGFGIGYITGDVPFGRSENWSYSKGPEAADGVNFSTHLRIGNAEKIHFLTSVAESMPYASGGGPLTMGLGYYPSGKMYCFTGMSAGLYDRPGLMQRVRLGVGKGFDLDVAARIGRADDKIEAAASLGVVYRFSTSRPSE